MYLINARTHGLEYFVGDLVWDIPRYIILSHCWGSDEVLFQDMKNLDFARTKQGFTKIRYMCCQAIDDGLEYVWVDTCCINKESSAELSEAINSMFRWYEAAWKCYAYLSDLVLLERTSETPETLPPFVESRWFTRGWTLQELVAPEYVIFMDQNWAFIGTKAETMLATIADVTGIDAAILTKHSYLDDLTIAKRMSWAANRKTTREEDEAYCLLGLLGIYMPLLCGEGAEAFQRLQEMLLRMTTDQSLLTHGGHGLLARSPTDFSDYANVESCQDLLGIEPHELTNVGLRIKLPIIRISDTHFKAVLNCQQNGHRLVMNLLRDLHQPDAPFVYQPERENAFTKHTPKLVEIRLEFLLSFQIEELIISRYPEYPRHRSRWTPSSFALWFFISNYTEAPCVMTVKTLEPVSSWNLAIPSRLGRLRMEKGNLISVFNGKRVGLQHTGTVTLEFNGFEEGKFLLMIHFALEGNFHSHEEKSGSQADPRYKESHNSDGPALVPVKEYWLQARWPKFEMEVDFEFKYWRLRATLEPVDRRPVATLWKYALHVCIEDATHFQALPGDDQKGSMTSERRPPPFHTEG